MSERELRAWLILSFIPKIGAKGLQKLLRVASAEQLVGFSAKRLQALGLSDQQINYINSQAAAEADACLHWLRQDSKRSILTLASPEYPPLLKEIAVPPPVLFTCGDVSVLSKPQIAIVGSRHAKQQSLDNARFFAKAFCQNDLVVTSGLALGVDGHAHDGALQAGGLTVAVLGSGLNHIYPARHRELAQRVTESGVLVSEFRPDARPRAEHFPRRNRIISGLSVAVLVIEAAEKSGSLITARYAAEQGRDVFALPHCISSLQGRGCNRLIRQGAGLVECPEDVLEEVQTLRNWSLCHQSELFIPQDDTESLPFPLLLANVGSEAISVDILASRTNIPVNEVMMQLLELELSGHVVAVSGGYIRKGSG